MSCTKASSMGLNWRSISCDKILLQEVASSQRPVLQVYTLCPHYRNTLAPKQRYEPPQRNTISRVLISGLDHRLRAGDGSHIEAGPSTRSHNHIKSRLTLTSGTTS